MAAILDVAHDLRVSTISVTGPNPYAAGGFLVDASADISVLTFMIPTVTVLGVLTAVEYEIDLNVDLTGAEAFGKGVVKLVKHQNNQGSVGNVSGQPGGVTVQAALAANAATTHTHALNHNHGAVTSGTEAQAGAGSTAAATPDALAHVHSFTIPNFTATSAAGGSHGHNRPFEYEHNHPVTNATTDATVTEIGAVNLSTVTFKVMCMGFGKT